MIDLECAGRRYSAKLQQEARDRFEGNWSKHNSAETGPASATLYRSSAGDLLFGEWFERQTKYQWWAELKVVENFPDEK